MPCEDFERMIADEQKKCLQSVVSSSNPFADIKGHQRSRQCAQGIGNDLPRGIAQHGCTAINGAKGNNGGKQYCVSPIAQS